MPEKVQSQPAAEAPGQAPSNDQQYYEYYEEDDGYASQFAIMNVLQKVGLCVLLYGVYVVTMAAVESRDASVEDDDTDAKKVHFDDTPAAAEVDEYDEAVGGPVDPEEY